MACGDDDLLPRCAAGLVEGQHGTHCRSEDKRHGVGRALGAKLVLPTEDQQQEGMSFALAGRVVVGSIVGAIVRVGAGPACPGAPSSAFGRPARTNPAERPKDGLCPVTLGPSITAAGAGTCHRVMKGARTGAAYDRTPRKGASRTRHDGLPLVERDKGRRAGGWCTGGGCLRAEDWQQRRMTGGGGRSNTNGPEGEGLNSSAVSLDSLSLPAGGVARLEAGTHTARGS